MRDEASIIQLTDVIDIDRVRTLLESIHATNGDTLARSRVPATWIGGPQKPVFSIQETAP